MNIEHTFVKDGEQNFITRVAALETKFAPFTGQINFVSSTVNDNASSPINTAPPDSSVTINELYARIVFLEVVASRIENFNTATEAVNYETSLLNSCMEEESVASSIPTAPSAEEIDTFTHQSTQRTAAQNVNQTSSPQTQTSTILETDSTAAGKLNPNLSRNFNTRRVALGNGGLQALRTDTTNSKWLSVVLESNTASDYSEVPQVHPIQPQYTVFSTDNTMSGCHFQMTAAVALGNGGLQALRTDTTNSKWLSVVLESNTASDYSEVPQVPPNSTTIYCIENFSRRFPHVFQRFWTVEALLTQEYSLALEIVLIFGRMMIEAEAIMRMKLGETIARLIQVCQTEAEDDLKKASLNLMTSWNQLLAEGITKRFVTPSSQTQPKVKFATKLSETRIYYCENIVSERTSDGTDEASPCFEWTSARGCRRGKFYLFSFYSHKICCFPIIYLLIHENKQRKKVLDDLKKKPTHRLSPRRSFKGGKQEKEGRANKERRYDPNKETLPIQELARFIPRYATNNISLKGYWTRRSWGITQLSPRVRIKTPPATVKQHKERRLESQERNANKEGACLLVLAVRLGVRFMVNEVKPIVLFYAVRLR
ncbi:hypothetical protein BCR33DRAFT_771068 [Rhizoclosmatium globosum]|uniref:Uncharacterized protein n=1 Tax=Rhizoclosmatium globosum TaxID=329046 RepID=A0A1Y2BG96_9FUNG|nr:hypothetical protein BCR33DRAFT_771068 [Rhizoclosmatium globosum]|eukprot:ORY33829.1 hypothetical protein BCR33DRAFT_771068 [Rhizoclosmatium globosum]